MMIYLVIIEDRHMDTEVLLFSTLEMAMANAQQYLETFPNRAESVRPEDARMSEEDLAEAGWLFFECYSTEGDCVRIMPRELDAQV